MIDESIYNLISYSIRVVFLVALPITLILAFAGTVSAVLQSATGVKENAINYLTKLVALIAIIYFFFPTISQYLYQVVEIAYL